MKIVSDTKIYHLPLGNNHCISIVNNNNLMDIVDCLSMYFINQKRSKCNIYDENGILIKMNDINFIHLHNDVSLESNMSFKTKSILNNELVKIIENNQEMFKSIEGIRTALKELETDSGMFKFSDILGNGLENRINISMKNFSTCDILPRYEIEGDYLNDEIKRLIIVNLCIYLNRDKINIIYFDNDITSITEKWIKCLDKNCYVFINNDSLIKANGEFDLLIPSDKDFIEHHELDKSSILTLSFLNHKYIKDNLCFINQKNIELYNNFIDTNTTFFLTHATISALEA